MTIVETSNYTRLAKDFIVTTTGKDPTTDAYFRVVNSAAPYIDLGNSSQFIVHSQNSYLDLFNLNSRFNRFMTEYAVENENMREYFAAIQLVTNQLSTTESTAGATSNKYLDNDGKLLEYVESGETGTVTIPITISGSDDSLSVEGTWMATESDTTYPYTYLLLTGADEGTWAVSGNIATKNGESYIFSNGVYNDDNTVLLGFNLRKDIDTLFAIKSTETFPVTVTDGNLQFMISSITAETFEISVGTTGQSDYSSSIGWFGTTIMTMSGCDGLFSNNNIVLSFYMYWVKHIASAFNMFGSCSNIGTVNLDNLVSVGGYNTGEGDGSGGTLYMFRNCYQLTSVSLSKLETIGLTAVYAGSMEMFYGCVSLHEVDLSSLTTIKGTSSGRKGGAYAMFSGCTSLTSVYLSGLTTIASKDIGIGSDWGYDGAAEMFTGCPLTGVSKYNYKILTVDTTTALTTAPADETIIAGIYTPDGISTAYEFTTGQSSKVISVEGDVVTLSGT